MHIFKMHIFLPCHRIITQAKSSQYVEHMQFWHCFIESYEKNQNAQVLNRLDCYYLFTKLIFYTSTT